MFTNIILVHIGDTYYTYINDCLEQIRIFNDCPVYLVSNAAHEDKILKNKNITFVRIEDLELEEHHKTWQNISNYKDAFWRPCTERFFYVENVMKKFNLKNSFHIETDNLLYFNLETELPIFEKNYQIAAIFDSEKRCVPGFFYYKDVDKLNLYTSMLASHPQGGGASDMYTWQHFRQKYPDIISNLPRFPKSYNEKCNTCGHHIDNRGDYIRHIGEFKAVFDGAEIGQYLGGLSPRNSGGAVGMINGDCVHKINKNFNFVFERDEQHRRVLYLYYKGYGKGWNRGDGECYRVNNLHVHSKNLINFMSI